MISRYRCSIGGTQLDSILDNNETYKKYKDSLMILNIGYTAPEISRTIETAGDNDGGIITRTYRQKATVTVTFELHIYNTADRFAVCQLIKTLCSKGGTVTTSDRPGQALYNCVCEQYPEIDSSRDWTAPLTLVMSAYAFPYWQNTSDTVKSMTSKKTSATMSVPGNAPKCRVVCEVVAKAAFQPSGQMVDLTASLLTLTVGSTKLYINYPMKLNNYLLIDTDSNNNLRARVYENKTNMKLIESILFYIRADSSDKLLAVPGNNTVAVEAVKEVAVSFKVKGAWL